MYRVQPQCTSMDSGMEGDPGGGGDGNNDNKCSDDGTTLDTNSNVSVINWSVDGLEDKL